MEKILKEIKSFTDHCTFERKLDHKTIKAYKIDLKQFGNFLLKTCEESSFIKVHKKEIREYLRQLNQHFKSKTVKRKIASLKSYYTYCEQMNEEFQSPLHKIRIKIQETKQLPRTITHHQLKAIFQYLHTLRKDTKPLTTTYFSILRDLLTVELLFISGVRVSELSNLKVSDLSESYDTIRIMGKGKRERVIPVYTSSVIELLKEYMGYRNPENAYLLQNRSKKKFSSQSIRFMIRKYVKELNIKTHITPHMFRHTVATMLLENELDIRYIQHLLGHSSISTTEIYTHVTAQSYKEQILEKHPRRVIMNKG